MSEPQYDKSAFSRPQRQHASGVIHYFLKRGWALIKGFWPALAGLALASDVVFYVQFILIAVLVFLTLSAVLDYLRFTYLIEDQKLVIQRGVLERESLVIPFDRIQSVNLEESFWQRIVGVVSLRIDTAGNDGAEVELNALRLDVAELIKSELLSKPNCQDDREVEKTSNRIFLTVGWKKLLLVGLTQNHVRNALIAFGGLLFFLEPMIELLQGKMEGYSVAVTLAWQAGLILLSPFLAIVFLSIGVLISLGATVLNYFQLKLSLDDETEDKKLTLSGGLLRRFEFKLPLKKIQLLEVNSNLLQRVIGIQSLRIHQAKSRLTNEEDRDQLTIPGMTIDQVHETMETLPGYSLPLGAQVIRPNPFWLLRMLLLRWILAMLIGWTLGTLGLALGLLLGMTLTFGAIKKYTNHQMRFSSQLLEVCNGLLQHRLQLTQFQKLQKVEIISTWFMQRRNLVHLVFHTAAGPIRAKYLNLKDAERLRNWAIFQIEHSQGAWM